MTRGAFPAFWRLLFEEWYASIEGPAEASADV
jgi:hypothetical protein